MSEPFLSEEQARRLWERAAELQAEAAQKKEEEARREEGAQGRLLRGVEEGEVGYSLANIRQAGLEVGIQEDFLDLALAEEAILELEGGSKSNFWDRTAQRFLGESHPALEIRRRFAFPSNLVWPALEEHITSDPHTLELLEVWGEDPVKGSIAIFEAPYTYEDRGSLQFWSTVAEVRRYMVQVAPEGEGGCSVVIRAPLRRSRRVNLAVGGVLSGIGGALGGGAGLLGLMALSGGLAGAPLALVGGGLIVGGTVGVERLARWGSAKAYRWGIRTLEKALERVLTRIDRDLRRGIQPILPPT